MSNNRLAVLVYQTESPYNKPHMYWCAVDDERGRSGSDGVVLVHVVYDTCTLKTIHTR